MYLTQRMWHRVPAQFQRLTAFAIIAALAFSVGWAAGAYGGAAYTFLTTNRMPTTAVAPRITAASPALIGTGSAYDGQSYRSPHLVAVPASPALIGAGSAYDGQTNVVVRPARGYSPIRTAASSTYDGRAYRSAPAAALFVRDIPALHSTSSAYDGQ
jgi:hypothetical protein